MQFFISTLAITSLVSAGSGSGSGGSSGGNNGPWPPSGPSNPPIEIPSFPGGGNNGPWPPSGPSNPPIEIPSFPGGGNGGGGGGPTGPTFPQIEIPTIPIPGAGLPNAGDVSFGTITHGGSGCPQGTVSQNFNADRTAFTLLFDAFVASIGGPQSSPAKARKNCQLNIALNVPSGWQYSLATIDYRGYAQLDRGVSAEQSAIYYFQGEMQQTRLVTQFIGPLTKSYTIRDRFPTGTGNWSPCRGSANLNINSAISIKSNFDRATGLMTTDSIDGQVKVYQQFGLVWRQC